jgi:hypothetical protein
MDHPRRDVEGGLQVMAARGAGIEAMVDESAVDRLGRECDPLVLGMTGLPTRVTSVLALRRRRLGRLDDVGRGGLGGGGGVLIRIPESLCPLPYILSIADTLDLISVEAHGA